jgi:hypothetical protein
VREVGRVEAVMVAARVVAERGVVKETARWEVFPVEVAMAVAMAMAVATDPRSYSG